MGAITLPTDLNQDSIQKIFQNFYNDPDLNVTEVKISCFILVNKPICGKHSLKQFSTFKKQHWKDFGHFVEIIWCSDPSNVISYSLCQKPFKDHFTKSLFRLIKTFIEVT
jgi:hypothetical protein